MKEFEIRGYGKSELAMMYFPNAMTAEGALSNLNYWIQRCEGAARRTAGLRHGAAGQVVHAEGGGSDSGVPRGTLGSFRRHLAVVPKSCSGRSDVTLPL